LRADRAEISPRWCERKHVCFGVQSVDEAERELRAKGVDIVFVGRVMHPPNIFMRDNSGNLIEFIEQPDLW